MLFQRESEMSSGGLGGGCWKSAAQEGCQSKNLIHKNAGGIINPHCNLILWCLSASGVYVRDGR